MWKNNWKTALRHTLKNKTPSAINISGLAIGMAACLHEPGIAVDNSFLSMFSFPFINNQLQSL